MKVEVVTFNLAIQALAKENTYPEASALALNAKSRWSKIYSIINDMISNDCIICLQEVSVKYKAQLTVLFSSRNYVVMKRENYGNSWNDFFMGVGIAYPDYYYLSNYQIITPSTTSYTKLTSAGYNHSSQVSWSEYSSSWFFTKEKSMVSKFNKVSNRFPLLTLTNDKTTITLLCIHMPGRHEDPEFMTAFLSMIIKSIKARCNLILLGDFNSTRRTDHEMLYYYWHIRIFLELMI